MLSLPAMRNHQVVLLTLISRCYVLLVHVGGTTPMDVTALTLQMFKQCSEMFKVWFNTNLHASRTMYFAGGRACSAANAGCASTQGTGYENGGEAPPADDGRAGSRLLAESQANGQDGKLCRR
jgi:hypothetical protein